MADAGPRASSDVPPAPAGDGPLETAILFVDLVSSSEFASILGLEAYAQYVDSFVVLCEAQCEHFFGTFHKGKYRRGEHYGVGCLGDELVVYLHAGKPANDVYQLVCLAITLKCGWLGESLNAERVAAGAPATELAVGIHWGPVWARRVCDGPAAGSASPPVQGYVRRGFAINVAKRVETASREGEHFRVMLSDGALKQLNRRIRHVLFGPRRILSMKGVVVPVAVAEVMDCFVDVSARLEPKRLHRFREVARRAMRANSFDLWIHSCLQILEEAENGRVSDERLDLCRQVLNLDPSNAVAMYYAAQGLCERGDRESARLYLEDLTRRWPNFADGWLELCRVHKHLGNLPAARAALLQARRFGVDPEEEALPEAS